MPRMFIIGHLNSALARNSNFLLNVGPDRRGRIVASSVRALTAIPELRRK